METVDKVSILAAVMNSLKAESNALSNAGSFGEHIVGSLKDN